MNDPHSETSCLSTHNASELLAYGHGTIPSISHWFVTLPLGSDKCELGSSPTSLWPSDHVQPVKFSELQGPQEQNWDNNNISLSVLPAADPETQRWVQFEGKHVEHQWGQGNALEGRKGRRGCALKPAPTVGNASWGPHQKCAKQTH